MRTARWKADDGRFCVNADEKDEWCFVLEQDGATFRSSDGKIVYTPN